MDKAITVDASVARASGTTEHSVSKACRDFLQNMLGEGHRVAVNRRVRAEWDRHQSAFAREWQSTMVSRRKVQQVPEDPARTAALAAAIDDADITSGDRQTAAKDALLLECAWGSDGLVASLDDKVRSIFSVMAKESWPIGDVVWVNPSADCEEPIPWLKAGARSEARRKLRNYERK